MKWPFGWGDVNRTKWWGGEKGEPVGGFSSRIEETETTEFSKKSQKRKGAH